MRDAPGLDSISGFFLTCLGARAGMAAGLPKAVTGLFGYLCRISF